KPFASSTFTPKPIGQINYRNDRIQNGAEDFLSPTLLARDIHDDTYISIKNKLVLKQEHKLKKADASVYSKLAQIKQNQAFKMALVPYWHWPWRLSLELKS
ncbi:hypothetical protein HI914_02614, partial [Erysiphe necator]